MPAAAAVVGLAHRAVEVQLLEQELVGNEGYLGLREYLLDIESALDERHLGELRVHRVVGGPRRHAHGCRGPALFAGTGNTVGLVEGLPCESNTT